MSRLQNLGYTAFSFAGSEELRTATELVQWGAKNGMHHPQFTVMGMTDDTATRLADICQNEVCQPSILALLFAGNCPTKDPAAALEALKPQLARAKMLAPKRCIVVGPLFRGLGDPSHGLANPSDAERQIEFLQRLAEHVRQYDGMEIGLEPLNRFESLGPNTVAQTDALMTRAGVDFGFLLDTFHQTAEEANALETWQAYGKRAPLFHLSPNGRQHLGFGPAVNAEMVIQAVRWGRPLVMELFGSDTPDGFFPLLGVHDKGTMTCKELFLEGQAYLDKILP